ncbi:MAG TPA: hypothetical protein VK176_16190 [Phycisphaerales bacterium]|nr:hypothetical protein [Phycisphaerales bacterium]
MSTLTLILGIAAAVASQWNPCDPPVRDPVSGALADGTAQSVGILPSVIMPLGQDPAILVDVQPLDKGLRMDCPLNAGLIAFRSVEIAGGEVHRFHVVPLGTNIQSGIFKNPGPYKLAITIVRDHSLDVIELEPGFGLLIGDETIANPTHRAGCRCVCKTATTQSEYITLDCPSSVTAACDGAAYNGMSCLFSDDYTWGQAEGCTKVPLPIDPIIP